jgi:hypothetical protein|tara:strand:- start:319 stop:495 length:177 start_codon:yes stop_codon:yes gene_type:complete
MKSYTKSKGIPLHLMDEMIKVKTIGGGTRVVLKNPSVNNLSYKDFIRNEDGNIVLRND